MRYACEGSRGIGELSVHPSNLTHKSSWFQSNHPSKFHCLFAQSITESIIALNNSIHGTKHDQKMQFFSIVFAGPIQTTVVTLATAEKPGSFETQTRFWGIKKNQVKSLYVECPTSPVITPPCFLFFCCFFQFLSHLNIVGLKLSIWKVSHCEGHLVKKWEDFSKSCGRKT